MRIVLTYDEIKEALAKVAQEKVSEVIQVDPDNCYFTELDCEDGGDGEMCLTSVEFCCDIPNEES